MFERIYQALNAIDYILNTSRKRHIAGGILLSVSVLLCGMALTIITINNEEQENEEYA